MKVTGIVRRLDDLGRIVIPKEIRRKLRLSEGDPLEFYIEDNKLMLKRYNPLSLNNEALQIASKLLKDLGISKYAIYDTMQKLCGTSSFPAFMPEAIQIACSINSGKEWIAVDLPAGVPTNQVEIHSICVFPIYADNQELIGYLVCDANEYAAKAKDTGDAQMLTRLAQRQVVIMIEHLCSFE